MANLPSSWRRTSGVQQRTSRMCEAALSKVQAISSSVIEAGDFRIDVDCHSAVVRGRELHLSSGEFDVLIYLTTHKRRVVTPRTTLATKSEDGGVCQTEFLRNLLTLRKKLQEEAPDARYIQVENWILYDFHPGT